MPHMRYCEDQGPRVKTAEGAFRLGLDSGGLKLRSLAGMERKADAYLKEPAMSYLLLTTYWQFRVIYLNSAGSW